MSKCQCGAHAVNSDYHQDYCPLHPDYVEKTHVDTAEIHLEPTCKNCGDILTTEAVDNDFCSLECNFEWLVQDDDNDVSIKNPYSAKAIQDAIDALSPNPDPDDDISFKTGHTCKFCKYPFPNSPALEEHEKQCAFLSSI